jgi:hypothetical protein
MDLMAETVFQRRLDLCSGSDLAGKIRLFE